MWQDHLAKLSVSEVTECIQSRANNKPKNVSFDSFHDLLLYLPFHQEQEKDLGLAENLKASSPLAGKRTLGYIPGRLIGSPF